MRKKIAALLLSCIILFGLAAACSGNNSGGANGGAAQETPSSSSGSTGGGTSPSASTETATETPGAEVSGGNETPAAAEEEPDAADDPYADIAINDFSKFYTFEFAGIGMQFGGDAMADFIIEKFNFTIDLSPNDATAMMLRMVSDDLPDQFGNSYASSFYSQCIADEYAYRFPDELLKKFPILWDYVNTGVLSNHERLKRGARYSLPTSNAEAGLAFGMGWHWRKDWAANLGLEKPKTMDDVYEVMRAFTFNDPTGTGRNTYGLSDWIFTAHMSPWLDYFNWFKIDGQWIPGYLTDEMVEGMRYWNRAFNEGIINPEANINNTRDEWAQGNVGMGVFHADGYWINQVMHLAFAGANPDIDPYDSYELIGPFSLNAGETAYWQWNNQPYNRIFDSKLTDDQIFRLLSYYEWILSPEGRDFLAYGFLGVDYYINEDGLAVEDREIDEDTRAMIPLWNLYPSMGVLGLGGPGWFTEPSQPPRWTTPDLYWYNRDVFDPVYNRNLFDPNLDIVMMKTPARDDWTISDYDIETKMNEILTFSTGTFEQEWRSYLANLVNQMGLQRVLDEVNEQAAALGL